MTLIYIIISTTIISLVALIGIFFISISKENLNRLILWLVTFATGVLLGGAIFHLIPEAFGSKINAPFWILIGILSFFVLEKYLFWRHCHDEDCMVHPFRYLNLIGDGVHNFIDGTVIAAAFVADTRLGLVTSILTLAHEIPHEMGNFGILVYSGLTRERALFYNLVSAMTCIIGGLLSYMFATRIDGLTPILIALAGGNFLYIAMVDLLPEFRKVTTLKGSAIQLFLFSLGIFFMWILKFAH